MNIVLDIDWRAFWNIIKLYVFPETGTLVLNSILFFVFAVIVAIVYNIILYRKKIFKRIPRYYNWIVKLYIPFLFVGIVYIFLQFGLVWSAYKVIDDKRPLIVEGIYNVTLLQFFESNAKKEQFIEGVQTFAKTSQEGSKTLSVLLKAYSHEQHSGNDMVDHTKNKLVDYFIDTYGDDIYTLAAYGLINKVAPHVNLEDNLSYDDFHGAMSFLLEADHKTLEKSVVDALDSWCDNLITAQFKKIFIIIIVVLLIIMFIPFIEYFIYKKWVEPKYLNKLQVNSH